MTLRGGIDLGGTKVQAVVVDEANEVRGQARAQTPLRGGPPAVAATMAGALREAAEQAGADPRELTGVGVGSPGQVDDAAGTVSSAKNLTDWAGTFALAQVLRDDLGIDEVRLSNDVGAAADAESRLGAAKDAASFLGVFWGTGVGGAVILDGLRWRGRGFGGEFGHMVIKLGGARCPCGRLGHVEAYAGRGAMEAKARELQEKGEKTVLFKLMEEKGRDRLTSGIWEKALRQGDEVAEQLVERGLQAIAAGAASVVNLLDVEAVVLGGGLGIRFGEPMAERLREAMLPHLFVDQRPPAVRVAELGDLGGALGASLMVAKAPSPVPAG
jgi:glucokinase